MRRLYLQFYLTIVAILVIAAATAGLLWHLASASHIEDTIDEVSEFVSEAMPPAQAAPGLQQAALERLHRRHRVDLGLYAADGEPIAAVGRPLPPFRPDRAAPAFRPGIAGPIWTLRLNDGRWLVARLPRRPWRPGVALLVILGTIGFAVAIGAWPIARRLTRRIERLQSGVEQLGGGDLAARVPVEGKDEVAALADSFNRAAGRIEDLVKSHKMLLANCSHELRTPLTRINMALALAGDGMDDEKRAHLKADIAELDQLIGEILLASRLDATAGPERTEDVDLLALAAEEGARYDASVTGTPVMLRGDPALLRRMIRNLLENARHHGGARTPDVRVGRAPIGRAEIEVRDHGPGIPEAEREKIFAPFYRLTGSAETGRGSGLGLALVRQIARSHGGDVQCLAAEGGGSLFRITLPLTV
jgi:signal transduction histidine kinase